VVRIGILYGNYGSGEHFCQVSLDSAACDNRSCNPFKSRNDHRTVYAPQPRNHVVHIYNHVRTNRLSLMPDLAQTTEHTTDVNRLVIARLEDYLNNPATVWKPDDIWHEDYNELRPWPFQVGTGREGISHSSFMTVELLLIGSFRATSPRHPRCFQ